MASKRVNFTLDEELHTEASKYAEDRGWTFSGLVARALTRYMQEGDSSPGPSPALTPSKEELIPVMETALRSGEVGEYLKTLIREVVADLSPEEKQTIFPKPPQVKPPHSKIGSVEITDEMRERMHKFRQIDVSKASGIQKGDISRIYNGLKPRVEKETLDKLEAALISLEAEAAKNSTLADG